MNIHNLADLMKLLVKPDKNAQSTYSRIRNFYIKKGEKLGHGRYQSPSINPSAIVQRSKSQNTLEHSVYQRADFTPVKAENDFNKFFKPLSDMNPKTLFFNSGMAAISTLMFYLNNSKKGKRMHVGENAYFETKWLAEDYLGSGLVNEYSLKINKDTDILWLEYPINCTQPSKYPFDKGIDLSDVFKKLTKICKLKKGKRVSLVIDYTLYFLPFNIGDYVKIIPQNLDIYLVTSLQKHRGYGLDLVNGGALTFYSHSSNDDYEYLKRLRTITGTSITQETLWTMPPIKPVIINKLIKDSSRNAYKVFKEVSKHSFEYVKFYYSQNRDFKTSFIFIEIDEDLVKKHSQKPFLSELLIQEIISSAKKNNAVMIHGTSFGLPTSRIFKNSERYENTNSLRVAIGYDEDQCGDIAKVLIEGTTYFSKKILL